jgi:hypothetical protein
VAFELFRAPNETDPFDHARPSALDFFEALSGSAVTHLTLREFEIDPSLREDKNGWAKVRLPGIRFVELVYVTYLRDESLEPDAVSRSTSFFKVPVSRDAGLQSVFVFMSKFLRLFPCLHTLQLDHMGHLFSRAEIQALRQDKLHLRHHALYCYLEVLKRSSALHIHVDVGLHLVRQTREFPFKYEYGRRF